MCSRLIIFLLSSFILSNSSLLVLYPDADLTNTHKLNATDVETIYFLFVDGFREYSNKTLIDNQENHICYSKECALSLANSYDADEVITSKIRVLGTKIIFTGMIFSKNGDSEFVSRVTALNVEDMENASMRLSKSLVNRKGIDESLDINNIIENDNKKSVRRESIHRVGGYIGYLFPFGGSGYQVLTDDGLSLSSSIFQIGFSNYFEYQDNRALFLDVFLNMKNPLGFGVDLSFNQFLNQGNYSPFYGAGIGWYLNPYDQEDGVTIIKHGLALSAQTGMMLFRAYNTNVFFRLKYHCVVDTKISAWDNGVNFNVTLTREMTPDNKIVIQRQKTWIDVLLELLFFFIDDE